MIRTQQGLDPLVIDRVLDELLAASDVATLHRLIAAEPLLRHPAVHLRLADELRSTADDGTHALLTRAAAYLHLSIHKHLASQASSEDRPAPRESVPAFL